MATPARVRTINPREISFPHKRRGRIVGTDTRTIHDGYRAECSACGWTGTTTQYRTVASAETACHNDGDCTTTRKEATDA